MPGIESCQVWWAGRSLVRPEHELLLDDAEQDRRHRYRQDADRDRFTIGVALSRVLLGEHLGVAPAAVPLNRTCGRCGEPHGRPHLPGVDGVDFSVSHSGEVIAVAIVTSTGAAVRVGVDVEQIAVLRTPGLPHSVLSPAERAEFDNLPETDQDPAFFRYWVRKEALVKATGDGLTAGLRGVTVTPPSQPARLVAWAGRDALAARFAMRDLAGPATPGYAASLALLWPEDGPRALPPTLVEAAEGDAGALLLGR